MTGIEAGLCAGRGKQAWLRGSDYHDAGRGKQGQKDAAGRRLTMREMKRGVRPAWLGSVVGAILADGGEAEGGPA